MDCLSDKLDFLMIWNFYEIEKMEGYFYKLKFLVLWCGFCVFYVDWL